MTHPGGGGCALHLLSTHCLSPHPRPLSLNAALAGSLGRGGGGRCWREAAAPPSRFRL